MTRTASSPPGSAKRDSEMRLGLDLGGTKIEIIALDKGREVLRERIATPSTSYDDTIRAMRDLVRNAEAKLGRRGSVGVAIPGALSPVRSDERRVGKECR